jgi:hypothetical protein
LGCLQIALLLFQRLGPFLGDLHILDLLSYFPQFLIQICHIHIMLHLSPQAAILDCYISFHLLLGSFLIDLALLAFQQLLFVTSALLYMSFRTFHFNNLLAFHLGMIGAMVTASGALMYTATHKSATVCLISLECDDKLGLLTRVLCIRRPDIPDQILPEIGV